MNYLAHIYLSGSNPQLQVGGLLGDFVKGPLRGDFPATVEAGIRLHRGLDSFTDAHPVFREQLSALPQPWRRYGGILLDVYFDHLLAHHWGDFHSQPLDDFCRQFYANLAAFYPLLPDRARYFCDQAPKVNWLESYADPDKAPLMLNNLGKRLRRPVALGNAWGELETRRDCLMLSLDSLIRDQKVLVSQLLADHSKENS